MVSRMQAVEWALKPLLARGPSQGKEGAGVWPGKRYRTSPSAALVGHIAGGVEGEGRR